MSQADFRFNLVHVDFLGGRHGFEDLRYDPIKETPPVGCTARDWDYFGLECERPGANLLDAVAATIAEIRREHGLLMDDLGIEKVWEWFGDGPDEHDGTLVGHLLLMAVYRAEKLGYGTDDLVTFLRAVSAPAAGQ